MIRLLAATVVVALAFGGGGCPEWLEVDDEDDELVDELARVQSRVGPVIMPSAPAEAGGHGPIVPATAGLRVPALGYWTRARLDIADLVLPYTWAAFLHGDDHVTLRIEASRREDDDGAKLPRLHVVIPIALPRGTDARQLAGLTLGPESLAGAVASIRTTRRDRWLIELTHLSLERVDDELVRGTLEGVARRGARGQRERSFQAGFLALRAPEPR